VARLFITPREVDYISDLTKEITKDVIGQKIYFYKVRGDLSDVHEVYEEAENKVFDPPVIIDALIDWSPSEVYTGKFGSENRFQIEVNLQVRDLLDRKIDPDEGDFFSYGDTFYEIIKSIQDKQVYGEIEHVVGITLTGKQARKGLIDFIPHGPTSIYYNDPDAVQETFVQQRGFKKNAEGLTGDVRSLQVEGKVDKPISGPAQVSPKGGNQSKDEFGLRDSAFYSDS